ncbi:MAG: membrane protein insertase YidC [Thermodesulfobacteriota bacterium]
MDQNKRTLLAVALSAVVFLIWSILFPAPKNPAGQNGTVDQSQSAAQPAAQVPAPAYTVTEAQEIVAAEARDVTVDTPLFKARFSTQGGVLKSFALKKYKETIAKDSGPENLVSAASADKGPLGLLWNGQATWRGGAWDAVTEDVSLLVDKEGSLVFTGMFGGVRIIRSLRFEADSYLVREETRVLNATPSQVAGRLSYSLAAPKLAVGESQYNLTRVSWRDADGVGDNTSESDLEKEGVARDKGVLWGAVQDNYFILAAAPEPGDLVLKANHEGGVFRVALEKSGLDVLPGVERSLVCHWYLGPKVGEYLAPAPNDLSSIITYGWTDFLAKPLLALLNWLYGFVKNWGVAIILLTVIIKAVLWPLSQKSYKSMHQMKKLQPLMARIREQYKDDRQKMNEEMMRLYKTYKVNPMGGCLPMLVQLPVFIGLYEALLGAIELRHASFIAHLPFTDMIWLADLSAKDPYYVTPLIMGATMFLQQKLTPAPGDPTQAKIMLFMPVIFTFLFLNFPSGLVVYWLVNNVLSIAQQWWQMRKAS